MVFALQSSEPCDEDVVCEWLWVKYLQSWKLLGCLIVLFCCFFIAESCALVVVGVLELNKFPCTVPCLSTWICARCNGVF